MQKLCKGVKTARAILLDVDDNKALDAEVEKNDDRLQYYLWT